MHTNMLKYSFNVFNEPLAYTLFLSGRLALLLTPLQCRAKKLEYLAINLTFLIFYSRNLGTKLTFILVKITLHTIKIKSFTTLNA